MLPANRRILVKLDGVRFLFIVQVVEKAQKKARFFVFVGKGKLLIMKLFFEEFNLIFFTAEKAWPVLKCNQGSNVLENFEVHFLLCCRGNYVVKGKLMYL